MKRWLACFLLCLAALLGVCCGAEASPEIEVLVDGVEVEWTDAVPYANRDHRTMVPLRATANAMGLEVTWDQSRFTAVFTARYDNREVCPEAFRTETAFAKSVSVEFTPGKKSYRLLAEDINYDRRLSMDTAAETINGRIYAPIRYLAEALGYSVEWDQAAFAVILKASQVPESFWQDEGVAPIEKPWSADDYSSVLRYMMKNGILEYSVSWQGGYGFEGGLSGMRNAIEDGLKYSFARVRENYMEYAAFYTRFDVTYTCRSWDDRGFTDLDYVISLYPRADLTQEELRKQIAAFDHGCDAAVESLAEQGRLDAEMSDRDKALSLLIYVCDYLTYDLEYTGATPYAVLESGHAVCEGYTALYNGLCRRVGLPVEAIYGKASTSPDSGHVWNIYQLGEEQYFIDATWCDVELQDNANWIERESCWDAERNAYYRKEFFWVTWGELLYRSPERVVSWDPWQ